MGKLEDILKQSANDPIELTSKRRPPHGRIKTGIGKGLTALMSDIVDGDESGHHSSVVTKATQRQVLSMLDETCRNDAETGNFFFRSDTGTGKTTGFVLAVTDLVKLGYKFAIAVPTTQDAEEVFQTLFKKIFDQVEVWTSDHAQGKYGSAVDKSRLRKAPVFVGCHAFLLGRTDNPTRFIGEKDILIVDEVPTNLKIESLNVSDFTIAREKANELGLSCANFFTLIDDWAKKRQSLAEQEKPQAAFNSLDISQFLKFSRVTSIEVSNLHQYDKDKLLPVLNYIDALDENRGFERIQQSNAGHRLHHVWFEDVARHFKKNVIFSATAHLEGFQHSPDSQRLKAYEGSFVSYPNLDIREVPYPDIPKNVNHILRDPRHIKTATSQILDIVQRTEEGSNVLLVIPKAIIEHVRLSLDEHLQFDTRKVQVTNWGRDVGSNAYRDCTEVILWANYHKPKHTTFSELCIYTEEPVNDRNLSEAQKGKFTGRVLDLQDNQLYASIKQMGARGKARFVQDDGTAMPMRLWICWADLQPELLQSIFPESTFSRITDVKDEFKAKEKGAIISRVIDKLISLKQDQIDFNELKVFFPNIGKYTKALQDASDRLKAHGWEYVPGKRGRYNPYPSSLVRIKPSHM